MSERPGDGVSLKTVIVNAVILLVGSWCALLIDTYTGHLTADYIPQPNTLELADIPFIWTPGMLFCELCGLKDGR